MALFLYSENKKMTLDKLNTKTFELIHSEDIRIKSPFPFLKGLPYLLYEPYIHICYKYRNKKNQEFNLK